MEPMTGERLGRQAARDPPLRPVPTAALWPTFKPHISCHNVSEPSLLQSSHPALGSRVALSGLKPQGCGPLQG